MAMASNNDVKAPESTASSDCEVPKTYTELQYSAMVASKDAYISHLEKGHARATTSLKRKHDAAFAELKTTFTAEKDDILANRDSMIQTAVANEHSRSKAVINLLHKQYEDVSADHETLQTTFDETLAEKKAEIANARSMTSRKDADINALKQQHSTDLAKLQQDHAKEIAALKRKTAVGPSSWIQLRVTFRGTSKKTKLWYKKWGDKLEDGLEEVLGREPLSSVRLNIMRRNNLEKVDVKQPLDKQGIRDGDSIIVTKL